MTQSLPKISIITPSYNQGEFLEQTIASVLEQGYPNLEYFIIDGGSTDQSVSIIKKYAPHLNWWVSEKDSGQSEAINKGLMRASGDIIAWINSDDFYLPGALHEAAKIHREHPEAGLFHGDTILINPSGQESIKRTDVKELPLRYFSIMPFAQPSSFFTRKALDSIVKLEDNLHFGMDFDLLIRIALQFPIVSSDFIFSKYRLHKESKTVRQLEAFAKDWQGVFSSFLLSLPDTEKIVSKLESGGLYVNHSRKFQHNRSFSASEIRRITSFFLEYQMHLYYQVLRLDKTKQIAKILEELDPEFYHSHKLDNIVFRATVLPVPLIRALRTITR